MSNSCIKIPKNVVIYIHQKKNFLLIKSSHNQVLIKIDGYVFKSRKEKIEFLHILPDKKETLALIKRSIIEVSFKNFRRLKLNGIGYKCLIISKESTVLHFKLGYSHSVYFKLPKDVTAKLTKNNILFLFSNSLEKLFTISEAIKNCKIPDPYKGKGIMYVNDKIKLKVGKKL